MYCSNCGNKAYDGDVYCQICGKALQIGEESKPLETQQVQDSYSWSSAAEQSITPPPMAETKPEIVPDVEVDLAARISSINTDDVTEIPGFPTFPEVAPDGYPDPTNSGHMTTAENATEIDAVTKAAVSKTYVQSAKEDLPYEEKSENYSHYEKHQEAKKVKKDDKGEVVFFGKGAFAFCVVVIFILSVLCGIMFGIIANSEGGRLNAVTNKPQFYTESERESSGYEIW